MKKLLLLAAFLGAVYALGNGYLTNLFVVAALFALPALGQIGRAHV